MPNICRINARAPTFVTHHVVTSLSSAFETLKSPYIPSIVAKYKLGPVYMRPVKNNSQRNGPGPFEMAAK